MSNGKGSTLRPITDKEHFDSEFERIFPSKLTARMIRDIRNESMTIGISIEEYIKIQGNLLGREESMRVSDDTETTGTSNSTSKGSSESPK
jgi:hypothetical protein